MSIKNHAPKLRQSHEKLAAALKAYEADAADAEAQYNSARAEYEAAFAAYAAEEEKEHGARKDERTHEHEKHKGHEKEHAEYCAHCREHAQHASYDTGTPMPPEHDSSTDPAWRHSDTSNPKRYAGLNAVPEFHPIAGAVAPNPHSPSVAHEGTPVGYAADNQLRSTVEQLKNMVQQLVQNAASAKKNEAAAAFAGRYANRKIPPNQIMALYSAAESSGPQAIGNLESMLGMIPAEESATNMDKPISPAQRPDLYTATLTRVIGKPVNYAAYEPAEDADDLAAKGKQIEHDIEKVSRGWHKFGKTLPNGKVLRSGEIGILLTSLTHH